MTIQNLKLLRFIINDSITKLEKYYAQRSLDFPDLDKPRQFDAAEAATSDPDAVDAINALTAASFQLMATVRPPFLSLLDAGTAYQISSCLRIAEQIHAIEYLREAGPEGRHINDIAANVGMEPSKLARIFRVLATHHIFREVKPDVFANNRISSYLDTGKDAEELVKGTADKYSGTNGAAAFIDHMTDETMKASSYLYETVSDAVTGPSFSNTLAPVQVAFKADKQFFSWIEEPSNERRFKRYGAAIRGTSLWNDPSAILQGFDWGSLTSDDLLVDVGGGTGMPAMYIANAYPQVRILIQERPTIVEQGKAFWSERFPEALNTGRISFQVHEFFDSQPADINASVFLLRTILHDWPDQDAERILLHLRRAAKPRTKLLIADYIIPYACRDDSSTSLLPGAQNRLPPPPLLANYGKAAATAYELDMTMFTLFNGQERTLPHFVRLTKKTGWNVIQVHRRDDNPFGYIVAEPAELLN